MEERLGELSRALSAATQTASQLPGSTDLDFYCSIDRGVQRSLADATDRLGEVMLAMRAWIQGGGASEPGMDDAEHVAASSTFTAAVGDLVDHLLERTDVYLDEHAGRRPIASADRAAPAARADVAEVPTSGPLPAHLLNAPIPPPQRLFTTKPDNSAERPWRRPLRRGKPHAKVPLGWRDPTWHIAPDALVMGPYSVEGDPRLNPYHVEIHAAEVPAAALAAPAPEAPEALDLAHPAASTDACPFRWVKTAAELRALQAHLAEDRVREIAVDLEHHSKHSYLGIVCLMQISTRYGDWIVDTLADEIRESAESLNEVFTDPAKVLVLHGADHDVLWLQRDFGVYLTCLFDTYHATNVLNLSVHSLSFLLQRYTAFEADKRFQLADWRIRPLPKEMLYYARSDTHSLLYIYDKLREELLQQGGPAAVREVFERSKATASKVYAKEPWDAQGDSRTGWHTLWLRHGGDLARAAPQPKPLALMGKEERLMRRLHQWRDAVARDEDEGAHYLLSIQSLMHLVFRMPTRADEVRRALPATAAAVRQRAAELAHVIHTELEAWNADAEVRGRDAQQQLDELVTHDAVDLGEAVPMPAAVAETSLAADEAPTVRPGVWDAAAPSAAPSSRLFAGLLTADGQGSISGRAGKKRKSLFDMPDTHTRRPPGVLSRIHTECADLLRRVFGGAPSAAEPGARPDAKVEKVEDAEPEGAESESAAEPEGAEAKDAAPANDNEAGASGAPPDDAPAEPAPARSTLAPALDDSDDEIVPVTKKVRWTKDQKRARKAQKAANVQPFDYANATSVLDAPRAAAAPEVPERAAPKRERKQPEAGGVRKTAKRKNDMRSSNRSATFGKRK
ncbi:exosome nuclease subunit [Malassezia obtusa]|uniref:Exosome nuclease subunit n=1 Tax=Malassezia obtusa TaxID=76774 RepID=A0AAF0IVN7_9BASI|nr:exosome nuclease subunit [Malassezia obtusa]